MIDEEIFLYQNLMKCIENKEHGNYDESDVQRALGALYYSWLKKENKYDSKYEEALDEIEKYCTYMKTFNEYNKANKGLNVDEVLDIINKVKEQ